MALIPPTNFARDIASKDTALFPVVQFKKIIDDNPVRITISTNNITENGEHWLPLLLNVPSLKESIDIEKRNYKISNVTLDITNYEYNSKRFSELFSETYGSAINVECRIYWASPSTMGLYEEGENPGTGAMQIYLGTIRRYDHDEKKVNIVVEDRSQATLHKDLPLQNTDAQTNYLGVGDDIPDKYKLKPIPMVFGYVAKSPCLITKYIDENNKTNMSIIADNDNSESKIVNYWFMDYRDQSLYFYDNDGYTGVPRKSNSEPLVEQLYEIGLQYYVENNKIIMLRLDYNEPGDPIHTDTLADNIAYCTKKLVPSSVSLYNHENWYETSPVFKVFHEYDDVGNVITLSTAGDINALRNDLDTGSFEVKGHVQDGFIEQSSVEPYWYDFGAIEFGVYKIDTVIIRLNYPSLPPKVTSEISLYYNGSMTLYNDSYGGSSEYNTNDVLNVAFWIPGYSEFPETVISIFSGQAFQGEQVVEIKGLKLDHRKTVDTFSGGAVTFFSNNHTLGIPWASNKWLDFTANISSSYFIARFYIEDFDTRDFYTDVEGRISNTPQADQIIKALISEVDSDVGENIQITGAYSDWKYAFTIDKKVNSKRLLEGLASASPFIPHFDNRGNFRFTVIKPIYYWQDEPNHLIKEIDVISFTTSRTRIEDVVTHLELDYNWDYGKEGFLGSEIQDITQLTKLADYKLEYYGLPSDHSETKLSINDQGKYIRKGDHNTAQKFVEWYLYWHCNQHLKIRCRLPLSAGLSIEIGDIVEFDSVIGGVKPYGIDYSKDARYTENEIEYYGDNVNGQQVFPDFMCISTNKTLEYVEVELIQMHNLSSEPNIEATVYGVTDSLAWNYLQTSNGEYVELNDIDIHDESMTLRPPQNFPTDSDDPLQDEATGASVAFNNLFKEHNVCPILNHPNTEDYAVNYPEEQDGDNLTDLQDNYFNYNNGTQALQAKAWWEAYNAGVVDVLPKLYSIHECTWEDVHEHEPRYIGFKYYFNDAEHRFRRFSGDIYHSPLQFVPVYSNGQEIAYTPRFNEWWDDYHDIQENYYYYDWIYLRFSENLPNYLSSSQETDLDFYNEFSITQLINDPNAFELKEIKIEVDPTMYMYNKFYFDDNGIFHWGKLTDFYRTIEPIILTDIDPTDDILNAGFTFNISDFFPAYDANLYEHTIWTMNLTITIKNIHNIENVIPIRIRFGTEPTPASTSNYGQGE